jgi:ABC-2 type transport system ATP-binding protein
MELNVKKGEIYGFIGKNGAGKSTTMNILAGLSHPTEGICIVNGRDVTKIDHPSDLNIGYLPEDPRFYPWMSAYETLDYLGSNGAHKVTKARIGEILDWVGLTESAKRRVGGFSRGMKQRLGIGAALIHDPELLIFDEPSSALDPEGRSDVLRLIKDLKQMGKTVFFSTHILSDIERVCDTVGFIVSGTMATEKPLNELLRDHIIPVYDISLQAEINKAILEKLKQLEGVTRVDIKDDILSVTVRDAALMSPRLLRFLCDQGIAINSFMLRKNDLEDIFIQEVSGK